MIEIAIELAPYILTGALAITFYNFLGSKFLGGRKKMPNIENDSNLDLLNKFATHSAEHAQSLFDRFQSNSNIKNRIESILGSHANLKLEELPKKIDELHPVFSAVVIASYMAPFEDTDKTIQRCQALISLGYMQALADILDEEVAV